MDEKMDKEQILQALENLGVDVQTERMKTEIYHLTTLFDQGQTVSDTLRTVRDAHLRYQLRPVLYYVTLRALIIALAQWDVLTEEQANDFAAFLGESIGVPAKMPKQGRMGNGQ